jgi:hypothetical protein
MNIPTPPDGYENLVKTDLELVEDRLEGTLSVESLGISAAATAKKKTELFGKASYAIIPFPKTANFVFIAIFESSGLIQPS